MMINEERKNGAQRRNLLVITEIGDDQRVHQQRAQDTGKYVPDFYTHSLLFLVFLIYILYYRIGSNNKYLPN